MKSAPTVSKPDMNKNPRQAGNGNMNVYKTSSGSPINIGNGKKVYLMNSNPNGNGARPVANTPNAVSTNQVRKR